MGIVDRPRLRCTSCRKGSLVGGHERQCDACGTKVAIRDGFVELLPGFSAEATFGQAAMEWPPLIRIYESRLWRRGPAATTIMGLRFAREQQIVLGTLGACGAMTVLDLACGPGLYTRAIARGVSDGWVCGLDISAPMLRYAVTRAEGAGIRNIEWVRGSAMDLPLADGSVDAVCCCGALHLFPDASLALAEIHRVLRPGGRFVGAVARRADSRLGEQAAAIMQRLGVRSWTDAEFRARLADAHLDDATCHHSARGWMIRSGSKARTSAAA